MEVVLQLKYQGNRRISGVTCCLIVSELCSSFFVDIVKSVTKEYFVGRTAIKRD